MSMETYNTRDRIPTTSDIVVTVHPSGACGPATDGNVIHKYHLLYGNITWRYATSQERADYEAEDLRLRLLEEQRS